MAKYLIVTILILGLLGILDAGYLTIEHYSQEIPPCSNSIWVDCGKVLKSKYATIGGLPVSVLGLAYYSSIVGLALVRIVVEKEPTFRDLLWKLVEKYARPRALDLEKILFLAQLLMSGSAAVFSLYFVYLQLGVLGAICLYCMFSAVLSFTLFAVTLIEWQKYRNKFSILNFQFPMDK